MLNKHYFTISNKGTICSTDTEYLKGLLQFKFKILDRVVWLIKLIKLIKASRETSDGWSGAADMRGRGGEGKL